MKQLINAPVDPWRHHGPVIHRLNAVEVVMTVNWVQHPVCDYQGRVTLLPGDVIATGTPAGVGVGFRPPKYLTHGDVVRTKVAGVGCLENTVRNRNVTV